MKNNLKNIVLIISLAVNIFFAVHLIIDRTTSPLDQFSYLSPRIFAEKQNDILINFIPLRTKLNQYTDKINHKLGIYFEYLPSGVSIGINEKQDYVLASLLKVPLAMGVYRQIEDGKMSFNQVLTVKKENIDSFFGDFWKQGVGTKITVREAIRLTLTKSDNTAKSVLFNAVPAGTIEDVFDALDIPKQLYQNQTVVTPKNYTSVLRSLYLSSYLSKQSSNDILDLLTQSEFKDKIVAGLPDNIKVAHKIGVYYPNDQQKSIYTDCGIVYVPKRPYILCTMTQSDEETARQNMRNVSKMIYDYVSSVN